MVGSGEALPFKPNTFDLAIATQVFEYFSEPHQAANQIHSVLKPGGALLMSVAAVAPRFVSEERWRFTAEGIRSTLASFSHIEIVPETFSLGGFLRTVNLGLHTFVGHKFLRRLFSWSVCPCLNLLGLAVESMRLTTNDQFTPNYSVLAFKDGQENSKV